MSESGVRRTQNRTRVRENWITRYAWSTLQADALPSWAAATCFHQSPPKFAQQRAQSSLTSSSTCQQGASCRLGHALAADAAAAGRRQALVQLGQVRRQLDGRQDGRPLLRAAGGAGEAGTASAGVVKRAAQPRVWQARQGFSWLSVLSRGCLHALLDTAHMSACSCNWVLPSCSS